MAENDVPNTSRTFANQQTSSIIEGLRVFTAGHSFHDWVANILDEIARSAGISNHQIAGLSSIGGSSVIKHWDVPDVTNLTKKALLAGKVDVLTLSPIWLPDLGIESFAEFGLRYNPDIRLTTQEFWLPNDTYEPGPVLDTHRIVDHNAATMDALRKVHALYFRDMDNYVTELNKKLGKNVVYIVPVGQAVLALREKIIAGKAPGLKTQAELFSDSWGHPTAAIQAVAAYCHYAVIYRRSPIGLTAPPVLTQSTIPAADIGLLNLLLQKLAWDAVIHHPMSGVTEKTS
jgi:hypothetical protein